MEHVLLHGPPGLGKTTLAHIISNEMGTHLTVTAGPALTKPGDLVGILTKLQPRDFSQVKRNNTLNTTVVNEALQLEGVDALGLDELDRKYLRCIAEVYEGGPVGLEAVAATLGDDAGTLEQAVEPFLLQIGFLARTRKGRQLTKAGAEHLGLKIRLVDSGE